MNKIKKKQDARTLWLSHGTCSYIQMYKNAVQTVLCCTYNMIFITIFKIKHKLYIASGAAPPCKGKILCAHLVTSL
jgi:hypothetical protein